MKEDQLLIAMGDGDPAAWAVYEARFRPTLEAYARRIKIPVWDWPTCVVEVLEDEGLRLCSGEAIRPVNLAAYLIAAVRHRFLRLRRAESCRRKHYDAAAEDCRGEWVVSALCSEEAIRTSRGADIDATLASNTLRRLANELREGLTNEEESILVWVSERVPHSQIAKWVGMSYEACSKRIWRLCRRLRLETSARRATYSIGEQNEIDRFMRRAVGLARLTGTVPAMGRSDVLTGTEAHGPGLQQGSPASRAG